MKPMEYRRKNRVMLIEKDDERFVEEEGQATIKFAANGRQFHCLSLLKEEQEMLFEMLKKHLSK